MIVTKCLSFWDLYMMFKIAFTNKCLTAFLYSFLSLQVSPVFPVLVINKNKNEKSQTESRLAWLCCSAPQIYFPSVHFWCKKVFPLWLELLCLFSAQIWWEHRWNSYLYRTLGYGSATAFLFLMKPTFTGVQLYIAVTHLAKIWTVLFTLSSSNQQTNGTHSQGLYMDFSHNLGKQRMNASECFRHIC